MKSAASNPTPVISLMNGPATKVAIDTPSIVAISEIVDNFFRGEASENSENTRFNSYVSLQ